MGDSTHGSDVEGGRIERLCLCNRRLWVSVSVMICALVLLAVFPGCKLYWGWQYDRRVEELHAAGEPVTIEEVLATIPQIPDGENALLAFAEANRQMEQAIGPAERVLWDLQGVRLTPDDEELVQRCLTRAEEARRLALEAAGMPDACWKTRLYGYSAHAIVQTTPEAREVSSLLRFLRSHASLAAAQGETAKAIDDLEVMRAVAQAGLDLPLYGGEIPALWNMDVEAALIEALSLHEFTADQVKHMQGLVPPLKAPLSEAEASFSRASLLYTIAQPVPWVMPSSYQNMNLLRRSGFLWTAWWHREHAAVMALDYYEMLSQRLEPIRKGDYGSYAKLEDALAYFEYKAGLYDSSPGDRWFTTCALASPDLLRVRKEFVLNHILTKAALACERYRLTNGHWPNQLADVVPHLMDEVPVNPFTGEPVEATKTYRGLRVWTRWRRLDENDVAHRGWSERDAQILWDFVDAIRDSGSRADASADINAFAEKIGKPIPVDPYTGVSLQVVCSEEHGRVFFPRENEDLVLAEGSTYALSLALAELMPTADPVADLLDVSRRGKERIPLAECLSDEYLPKLSAAEAAELREMDFTDEHLEAMGWAPEEDAGGQDK